MSKFTESLPVVLSREEFGIVCIAVGRLSHNEYYTETAEKLLEELIRRWGLGISAAVLAEQATARKA